MVIATWCQREETAATPFSEHEKAELQFLYDEWAHPYFVSIEEYERLMNVRRSVLRRRISHLMNRNISMSGLNPHCVPSRSTGAV